MKLRPVSMRKALTELGATNIGINRRAFWHVSGSFTLGSEDYAYSSYNLRNCTIPGSDDIDLSAPAPIFYHRILPGGRRGPNRFDLNQRFAALGFIVPLKKHEYDPWTSFKRKPKKTT
ncbi:MAG: hypothetical protein IKW19_08900 [Akkermansia sp.]|nr:hypothetical protein [Akkermansia sp.]